MTWDPHETKSLTLISDGNGSCRDSLCCGNPAFFFLRINNLKKYSGNPKFQLCVCIYFYFYFCFCFFFLYLKKKIPASFFCLVLDPVKSENCLFLFLSFSSFLKNELAYHEVPAKSLVSCILGWGFPGQR